VTTDIRLHVGLTTAVAAAVYRCARECLDNVRKHAEAHHVSQLLTADPTGLHMLIVDDGVGLPATMLSRTEGHLGMQLMKDAAKDLGGQLHVWCDAATGTTVTLVLPSTAVEEGDHAAALAGGRPLRSSTV